MKYDIAVHINLLHYILTFSLYYSFYKRVQTLFDRISLGCQIEIDKYGHMSICSNRKE